MDATDTHHDGTPDQLTLHVGDEERLFDRARRRSQPTELVVSPVELHQRNIQRRLREARLPKDAFSLYGPGRDLCPRLETAGRPTAAVDRVDRLSLIRSILEAGGSDEPTTLSSDRSRAGDPQRIEQIRTRRGSDHQLPPGPAFAAWGETADKIDEPIDDEAETILETGLGAERELRERTTKAVSETALLRRATRSITATDGSAWAEAFPEIERLTLLGLSSLVSAAYRPRPRAVGRHVPHGPRPLSGGNRRVPSGPSPRSPRYHRSRNGGVRVTGSDRLARSAPIDTPAVPTIEIASPTRRDEARSAMAVAAALRDSGVPVRDIAVAVRDLDPYEEPLFRAAIQCGIAPVFWTQLRDPDPSVRPRRIGVRGAGRGTPWTARHCCVRSNSGGRRRDRVVRRPQLPVDGMADRARGGTSGKKHAPERVTTIPPSGSR